MPTYLFKVLLCHLSRWCVISGVCECCSLSTKLYRHSTTFWYGHHKMFQVIVQESSSRESCVLDRLRKGYWPDSSVLQVMHFTLAAWWQAFCEDGFAWHCKTHWLLFLSIYIQLVICSISWAIELCDKHGGAESSEGEQIWIQMWVWTSAELDCSSCYF